MKGFVYLIQVCREWYALDEASVEEIKRMAR